MPLAGGRSRLGRLNRWFKQKAIGKHEAALRSHVVRETLRLTRIHKRLPAKFIAAKI